MAGMMLDAVDAIEAPRCVDSLGSHVAPDRIQQRQNSRANTRSYNCEPAAGHRRRIGRELRWHSGLTAGAARRHALLRRAVQHEGADPRRARAHRRRGIDRQAETKELNVRRAAEFPDWITAGNRTKIQTEGHTPTRRMDRRLER